jgi:hypothetical protein
VRLERRRIGHTIENSDNNHQAQQTRDDSEFHDFVRFMHVQAMQSPAKVNSAQATVHPIASMR